MTASLSNFLASLVAGGIVISAIIGALVLISGSDRLTRN